MVSKFNYSAAHTQPLRVLITAGGTGGHIFPGIALAHKLSQQGWSVQWLGTANSMEEGLVPKENIPFKGLNFKGVRGKGIKHAARGMWDILMATFQAVMYIQKIQPHLIVGFGGYPTLPALIAAWVLRVPVVLHEANRVLGMANRLAAHWAKKIAVSFPQTILHQKKSIVSKMLHTGAPLREAFEHPVTLPSLRYQQRKGVLKILVVGGSQGAVALNQIVPRALSLIPAEIRPKVVHQSGKNNIDTLKQTYSDFQIEAECVAFIDNILGVYLDVDVIICRAGALTIAELLAVGLPALYVPLPGAVDQPANANWCQAEGAGWYMLQPDFTAEALSARIMSWSREALIEVAETAFNLGIRNGTERLVNVCENVVNS